MAASKDGVSGADAGASYPQPQSGDHVEGGLEQGEREELEGLRSRVTVLEAVAATAREAVRAMRERRWWCRETRSLSFAVDVATDRKFLPLPAWIFGAEQFADSPAYFLLKLEPEDGFPSLDGAHDGPEGVAKARKLYGAIGVIRPPTGTRYLMLTVQEAPEPGGQVNQGAIDALNRMAR